MINRIIILYAFLIIIVAGCDINATKKAQSQKFYKKGLASPKESDGVLKREYNYFDDSEEDLLKKMRSSN